MYLKNLFKKKNNNINHNNNLGEFSHKKYILTEYAHKKCIKNAL